MWKPKSRWNLGHSDDVVYVILPFNLISFYGSFHTEGFARAFKLELQIAHLSSSSARTMNSPGFPVPNF